MFMAPCAMVEKGMSGARCGVFGEREHTVRPGQHQGDEGAGACYAPLQRQEIGVNVENS